MGVRLFEKTVRIGARAGLYTNGGGSDGRTVPEFAGQDCTQIVHELILKTAKTQKMQNPEFPALYAEIRGFKMVEAGRVELPSETESLQRLRACSTSESRAPNCRWTGHPMRQRPRRVSPKLPATRSPASLLVVASTPSRRWGFRVAAVV